LDTVMTLLRQRLSEIVHGSPLDEKTVMGPLANQVQLEKELHLIQRAREEGDTIVYCGETLPGGGFFLQPTPVTVRSKNT
ncbi:aldehyde dehydrogenase family protein, partial [Salmonella enterica]|uniref:aldehyde dehydrogenase family protein n=1 Tax=Salmonella enterica TaxID=28901 RepID=UPI003D32DC1A